MISLRGRMKKVAEPEGLKGFDDFQVSLGDVLRGERATQGKSLDDLKHELRIQPSYLLAIEEADPTAFDTPGFIAGYVRSYAKYLKLDPDWAFAKFCEESGFATAHGMSEGARPRRRDEVVLAGAAALQKDPFTSGGPFVPPTIPFFERLNFRAIGSMAVLLTLVGGLGYGAMNVVQKIQQVQVVPIENPPLVAADLDPLTASMVAPVVRGVDGEEVVASTGDLDRLYKPQTLEAPTFEPRDGPIANLDPEERGIFGDQPNVVTVDAEDPAMTVEQALALALVQGGPVVPEPNNEVVMFAVADVWASAVAPDGTVVFQDTMKAGAETEIPQTEDAVVLARAGNSNALYFRIDGVIYGPAGNGTLVKNIAMDKESLKANFPEVDLSKASNNLLAVLEKREQASNSEFVEAQN